MGFFNRQKTGSSIVRDALCAFSTLTQELAEGIEKLEREVEANFHSVVEAEDKYRDFIKTKDEELGVLLSDQEQAVKVSSNMKKLLGLS